VDSMRLAEKLDSEAALLGRKARIFIQVNISGEPQKMGFSLESAADGVLAAFALPNLRIEGLMGMAPHADEEAARRSFAALRALRDRLIPRTGPLALSMGMSNDFEAAIEEGADLVRIGSALFA